MTKCSFTAMASAAVALLLASAALAGDVRLASPGGGAIVLTSPDDWRHAKWPDMANTLSFTPPKGNAFQVLVTSLGLPPAHVKPGPEVLRQMVDEAARNAAPQSVEKTLRTEEFETATVQARYFFATDRNPKPGEFKYLTQGVALVQGSGITFSILSNGDANAAVAPALKMIRTARRE